jgi:hypothetical protein
VARTPVNSPSAETPTQTAPGNRTRNGSAARAAGSSRSAQGDRDGDRSGGADQYAQQGGGAAAVKAGSVEYDEDEERAGWVSGDVGGPGAGPEVEDVAGEPGEHGRVLVTLGRS